jgi:hypothetical protein
MTNAKYGPETATVDAFLRHLKAMPPEQLDAAGDAAWDAARAAAGDAAWDAARAAARAVAWDAAGYAARDAAGYAAGYAAGDAAGYAAGYAARYAANEIQGAALMRERGQPFFFLPMFGFATPEDIK